MGEVPADLFVVRKGRHIGRGHLLKGTNCQDAISLFHGDVRGTETVIGIICDGCSEGTASEVGAALASEFLVREGLALVGRNVPLHLIPDILYGELLEFLRYQVNAGYKFVSMGDRVNFIKNHLLFTVMGCIVQPGEAKLFVAGDGVVVINNDHIFIDQNDLAPYPAYHLIDKNALEASASAIPTTFDVYEPEGDFFRLAIGSDAWLQEKPLLYQAWGHKNPAGLQRQMNVWSEREKRFNDDTSLITIELAQIALAPQVQTISTAQVPGTESGLIIGNFFGSSIESPEEG